MSRRNKYRMFLLSLIVSGILGLGCWGVLCARAAIPSEIRVKSESITDLDLGWWMDLEVCSELSYTSTNERKPEKYKIACSLFGVIPLKYIQVISVEEKEVYTGGVPIGLYLETDGIYVIDYGTVEGEDGRMYEPARNAVKPGDYIIAIDNQTVREKETLTELIGCREDGSAKITLRRGESVFDVWVETVKGKDGVYKAGVWVRDNTQGIGTLTFVTRDRQFGALGHGMNDTDTGELLMISEGTLYETNIFEIEKGENGNPGEIRGTIHYEKDRRYGDILQNQNAGIYGVCSNTKLINESGKKSVEISYKQDIKKGKAVIRSAVNGRITDYDIEILDINYRDSEFNKGIVFQVTDQRLMEVTGGIVQGMSGSPILQDGKLIGAVTHVFVQDSSKGFGIFIENMLEYVDS